MRGSDQHWPLVGGCYSNILEVSICIWSGHVKSVSNWSLAMHEERRLYNIMPVVAAVFLSLKVKYTACIY